jgi:DNA-binding transcriptional ArsR family regulator
MQANYHAFVESIPEEVRPVMQKAVQGVLRDRLISNPELATLVSPVSVLSARVILQTNYPPPLTVVENLLPVGLGILSGRPKIGKSWLALQLMRSMATGDSFLGQNVTPSPSLYIALEDSARRLKNRMLEQAWPASSKMVDFLFGSDFREQIGLLDRGGLEVFKRLLLEHGYRLVVLDTLSRALGADQRDEGEVTWALGPLQEFAIQREICILLIDHHRKPSGLSPSPVDDILGSTAKAGVPDVIWGIYREQGKQIATLEIIGRELEQQSLPLIFNSMQFQWEISNQLPFRKAQLLEVLADIGPASVSQIASAIGQPVSHTSARLTELYNEKKVIRTKQGKNVLYALAPAEDIYTVTTVTPSSQAQLLV